MIRSLVRHNLRRSLSLVLRMITLSWSVRPWAVSGYFLGAILEITSFLTSIYATAKLGSLLAKYVTGAGTGSIWWWLWLDVIAAIGIGVAFWIMSWNKRLLYFQLVQWSTLQFHAALNRLDIPEFYEEDIRNMINKAQSGYSWQLANFSENTLELSYAILRFVATAAVVAQIAWWIIPIIALFLVPTLITESKLAKVQWFVWDDEGDDRHVLWKLSYLMSQVKNQMELRSSQTRQYVLDKIRVMNRTFYRKQEGKFNTVNRWLLPTKVLEVAGTATGSIILLRQFLQGVISLDRYFFLSGALLRIGSALNNIFGTLSRMQENLLFAENFFTIVDKQPQLIDKPHAPVLDIKGPPRIEFKNVSFTYPGQENPVFTNLSLVIEPGQHLAIVGENGAGKSTLIKLLLRFYIPDSGHILIDGQDLQDIAIESWYTHLATLFQQFNEYPFSIAENIEIARPAYNNDKQRMHQAAGFSNVDHFVRSYKHGWDTVLDNSFEKGVEPSGGQWQRVALARAFYRDANVLILDEPTAAIDARAEYDIFNNIFEQYQQRTAIIVSHRFSTVRKADHIVVIEHGAIVEQGSHRSLMKEKGIYYDLFSKQAEGYKE